MKAIFVASAVFPIEGLPARMIKSEFCNPPNILSKSPKPETIPEYLPFFLNAFSTNLRDDFVTDAKSLNS